MHPRIFLSSDTTTMISHLSRMCLSPPFICPCMKWAAGLPLPPLSCSIMSAPISPFVCRLPWPSALPPQRERALNALYSTACEPMSASTSQIKHRHRKTIPYSLRLFFIPPYTPEMNSIEQIWKEIRFRGFRNQVFPSLNNKVVDRLCETLHNLPAETTQSISGRQWIWGCFD